MNHYVQYGNVILKRTYCLHCKSYTIVLDGKKECCGELFEEKCNKIKIIVQPRRKRIDLSELQKETINEKQDFKCYYCNNLLGYYYIRKEKVLKSSIHYDHIEPFCHSHNNKIYNFVASCNICNHIKSDKIFDNMDDLMNYITNKYKLKKIEII